MASTERGYQRARRVGLGTVLGGLGTVLGVLGTRQNAAEPAWPEQRRPNGSKNERETFNVVVAMTTEGTVEAFRQAESLVAQRRPWEALRVLAPVVDVAGDKPSVQLLLGRAYLFSAQFQRAELAFLRVLEIDPSDHYARLVLGHTLRRQGRLTEARSQLKLAVTMYPDPAYQEALGEINADIATRHNSA